MNIGLDIDNVITEFDSELLKEMLIYDKKALRNSGLLNKKVYLNHAFDWTPDEVETFYQLNVQRFAQNLLPKKDCKKYIDKLLQEGHNVYLISNRVFPSYTQPYKVTFDWLNKYDINYTELVLSKTPDKTDECLNYKIDIMVDDRVDQCQVMSQNGIRCFAMKTKYNYLEKTNVQIIDNWKKLYEEIQKLAQNLAKNKKTIAI